MSLSDTARKIPGVAAAEDAITGALAEEKDLPIADYNKQSAADIAGRLNGFSQRELRMIDAYERKRENRATITDKIASSPVTSPGQATTSRASTRSRPRSAKPTRRPPKRSRPTSATTRTAAASSTPRTSASTAARNAAGPRSDRLSTWLGQVDLRLDGHQPSPARIRSADTSVDRRLRDSASCWRRPTIRKPEAQPRSDLQRRVRRR